MAQYLLALYRAAAEQRPVEVRPLSGGDLDDAIRLG
jgi:hypothetical protein